MSTFCDGAVLNDDYVDLVFLPRFFSCVSYLCLLPFNPWNYMCWIRDQSSTRLYGVTGFSIEGAVKNISVSEVYTEI